MSAWLKDTVERAVSTFVQAFIAVLAAAGPIDIFDFDVSTAKAAAVAGVGAALAVVKAALAARFPGTVSPASFVSDGGEG